MSAYLLPCVCGRRTTVTAAQAGQSIECSCGARLDVPSMRGLRLLESADEPATARRSTGWSDRHRAAFLLSLVALAGIAAAVYMAWGLRPAQVAEVAEPPEVFEQAWKNTKPGEVVEMFDHLKTGLDVLPLDEGDLAAHRLLKWGVAIALGASALALAAAVVVWRGAVGAKR